MDVEPVKHDDMLANAKVKHQLTLENCAQEYWPQKMNSPNYLRSGHGFSLRNNETCGMDFQSIEMTVSTRILQMIWLQWDSTTDA